MSRAAGLGDKEVFRAVVEVTRPANRDAGETEPYAYSLVFGPYRTVGAAKAAATRESAVAPYWQDRGHTAKGRVERASLAWESVD